MKIFFIFFGFWYAAKPVLQLDWSGFTWFWMTLSNLIVFCDKITRYADQRRTVDDAVCLSFNKAFNTIFQRILLTKLVNYSLDVQTNRCNSCLEPQVQRVAMNGSSSSRVSTCFLRCCLRAYLNIFLHDLEVEECTLLRFQDYTKVMDTMETLEGCHSVMQTGQRNGLTEPYKTQDGQMHLALTHPRAKQAGGWQAEQQPCRRGPSGPCGQLAKRVSNLS